MQVQDSLSESARKLNESLDKVCSTEIFSKESKDYKDLNDQVNHPSHYTNGSVECIEAIEAMMSPEAFAGYLRGNITKYLWRFDKKNGLQDLEKAQWYLNKLAEVINNNG